MKLVPVLKAVVVIAAVAYAALLAALYAFQDRFIFFPQPDRQTPYGAMTEVELVTPDGETLIGWYSAARSGCPTVLLFHGNASRLDRDQWRYERIIERGAGLFALAWRGYSGSTGEPSEEGLNTDAATAYRWLIDQGVAPEGLVVHGVSIGTGPATKLASEQQVGALILEAPYKSVASMAARQMPFVPVSLLLRTTFRSDEWIKSVAVPILIAHGTRDSVIPISQGEALFAIAPEPKQFEALEGADHNTLVRDGLYDRVWPFLETYGLLTPECVSADTMEMPS